MPLYNNHLNQPSNFLNVLANLLNFQDSVQATFKQMEERLKYWQDRELNKFQILNIHKFANHSAANARKLNMVHTAIKTRQEPSPSPDRSKFLKASASRRAEELPKTQKEDPRKRPSAKPTTKTEVLALAQM